MSRKVANKMTVVMSESQMLARLRLLQVKPRASACGWGIRKDNHLGLHVCICFPGDLNVVKTKLASHAEKDCVCAYIYCGMRLYT